MCPYVHQCTTSTHWPQRSEDNFRSPRTEDLLDTTWVLGINSSPLEELRVLLTAQPSLQLSPLLLRQGVQLDLELNNPSWLDRLVNETTNSLAFTPASHPILPQCWDHSLWFTRSETLSAEGLGIWTQVLILHSESPLLTKPSPRPPETTF